MSASNRIGPFITLRELGRGGMGIVFEAQQVQTGERVALKILLGGAAADAILRFEREAAALARVQHPAVVRLHSVGTADVPPWIAMELIAGESLAARLKTMPEGRLTPGEVQELALALSDALVACHQEALFHRDVKPANVLLRPDGRPALVDLGLARRDRTGSGSDGDSLGIGTLTATGQVVGTPTTMAPEQFDPDSYGRPGARADVWGLAATLYHALCGRPPFPGKTALAILTAIQAGPPPAPEDLHDDIPGWLSDLVLDGLTVKPEQRLDMLAMHERLLLGESAPRAPRPAPARGLGRALVVALPMLLVLLYAAANLWLPESPLTVWRETDAMLAEAAQGRASAREWRALAVRSGELDDDRRERLLDALGRTIQKSPKGAGSTPDPEVFEVLVQLDPSITGADGISGLLAEHACEHARHEAWLTYRPLTAKALRALEPIALAPVHRKDLERLIQDEALAVLDRAQQLGWRARLLELQGRPEAALELLGPALEAANVPIALLDQAAGIAFLYHREDQAASLLDRLLERRRDASDPTRPSVEVIERVIQRRRLHLRAGETEAAARLPAVWQTKWPGPVWSVEEAATGQGAPPWSMRELELAESPELEALVKRWRSELSFATNALEDLELRRELLLRLRLARPKDDRLEILECRFISDHGDVFHARAHFEALEKRRVSSPALRLERALLASYFQQYSRAAEILAAESFTSLADPELTRLARTLACLSSKDDKELEALRRDSEHPKATLLDRIAYARVVCQRGIEILKAAPLPLGQDEIAVRERCRDLLLALIAEEPRLVPLRVTLAEIQRFGGQFASADASLDRALALRPDHPAATLRVILDPNRETSSEVKIERLRSLVKRAPFLARARHFLVIELMKSEAPADQCLPHARAAIRRFPTSTTAVSHYFRCAALGGTSEEFETIKELLRLDSIPLALRIGGLNVLTKLFTRTGEGAKSDRPRELARFVFEQSREIVKDPALSRSLRRRAVAPFVIAAQFTTKDGSALVPVFEAALELKPESPDLVGRYIELMTKARRTRAATFHLHDSMKHVPKAARFVVDRSMHNRLFGTALAGLACLSEQGALTPADRLDHASLLQAVGQSEQALKPLEIALKRNPCDPVLHHLKIAALLALGGDLRQARAAVLSARMLAEPEPLLPAASLLLGLDPVAEIRHRDLGQLIQTEIWDRSAQHIGSLAFQQLRELDAKIFGALLMAIRPDDPEVRWLMFHVHVGREPTSFVETDAPDLESASRVLAGGLKRRPRDPALRWAAHRLSRLRSGSPDAPLNATETKTARALLQTLQQAGSRPDVQLAIARELRDWDLVRRLRPAVTTPGVELLDGLVRLPDGTRTYNFRQLLKLANSQKSNALVHLQAARALLSRAGDTRRTGNAITILTKVLELSPSHKESLDSMHRVYRNTTRHQELLIATRAALQARPESPKALELAIHAALGLGRLSEAREAAEVLRRVQPDHVALLRPELTAPPGSSQREDAGERKD